VQRERERERERERSRGRGRGRGDGIMDSRALPRRGDDIGIEAFLDDACTDDDNCEIALDLRS
jgi:hypothetical protein